MDPTTRWETEALRTGPSTRPTPSKSGRSRPSRGRRWVTLREAEAATGIPTNTLRKWVRKSDVDSYLESDGEVSLRMLDLDAVIDRAIELGRTIEPHSAAEPTTASADAERPGDDGSSAAPHTEGDTQTMIVPVDAWNKMLTQLGNLHEAGQQLAEARERAAKAETEAAFLRERLAEVRNAPADAGTSTSDGGDPPEEPTATEDAGGGELGETKPNDTTTYWRYLTSGWRHRRRR